MFPEIVYGPTDNGSDNIRNLSYKSLERCKEKIFRFFFFKLNNACLTFVIHLFLNTKHSNFTYFDNESACKVEQGNHPAPVKYSIWKDLIGHSHKNLSCGTKWRVIYHSREKDWIMVSKSFTYYSYSWPNLHIIILHAFKIAWRGTQTSYQPLEVYISIQLVSNLLQALSKLLSFWVSQLASTKLFSRHCFIAIYLPLNSLIDETIQHKYTTVSILTLSLIQQQETKVKGLSWPGYLSWLSSLNLGTLALSKWTVTYI